MRSNRDKDMSFLRVNNNVYFLYFLAFLWESHIFSTGESVFLNLSDAYKSTMLDCASKTSKSLNFLLDGVCKPKNPIYDL